MNSLQIKILFLFDNNNLKLASREVLSLLVHEDYSLVSIKRALSDLLEQGYLTRLGQGRSVQYTLSSQGKLLKPFKADDYLLLSEKQRGDSKECDFEVFTDIQSVVFNLS